MNTLKIAYVKNECEREQRIEALARQFVRNHIKRIQKINPNVSKALPLVFDSSLQRSAEQGDQDSR